MKKLFIIAICLFVGFVSCKKDKAVIENPQPEPTETYQKTDGAELFVNAQNYLMRTINYSLNVALLTPQMHGLTGESTLDTRMCPTVTGPFSNTADGSMDLIMDFGTECFFNNTLGGTPDTISGIITLKKFGGPITDSATNTFLEFTELKVNDVLIRFVPGNPASTSRIKFQFFTGMSGGFFYNAFIDGSVVPGGDPVFDRSQFQIVNCTTGDSLVLYPSYSGIPAFNFEFIDPDNPNDPPEYNYNSLVEGCYEININPITAFYYDATGTLQEDYNIIKVDNEPLLFKPLCKWLYGGLLEFDDIPLSDPNYTDMIDNPYMEINYSSDNLCVDTEACDPFVKVYSCEIFDNGICLQGADTTLVTCPL